MTLPPPRTIDSFHDVVIVRTWRIARGWHYAAEDLGSGDLIHRGSYGASRDAVTAAAAKVVRAVFRELPAKAQDIALAYWAEKERALLAAASEIRAAPS